MNRANFTNPMYLLRIKAAIAKAITEAPRRPLGIATVTVRNARGKLSLAVVAYAGKGFDILGGRDLDDDVRGLALDGLRAFHNARREQQRNAPAVLHSLRLSFPFLGMTDVQKRQACEARGWSLSLAGLSA